MNENTEGYFRSRHSLALDLIKQKTAEAKHVLDSTRIWHGLYQKYPIENLWLEVRLNPCGILNLGVFLYYLYQTRSRWRSLPFSFKFNNKFYFQQNQSNLAQSLSECCERSLARKTKRKIPLKWLPLSPSLSSRMRSADILKCLRR